MHQLTIGLPKQQHRKLLESQKKLQLPVVPKAQKEVLQVGDPNKSTVGNPQSMPKPTLDEGNGR